ncbi:MAG: toll/interleukin-1 receptor domain-containing protein, partial [Anaerolineae bacterium]|nr:toll/interleukin-1 receptor domain-containing protein [Anaerolineae bacterium]
MSRLSTATGSYAAISTQTRTIEQKRAMLRKAQLSRPDDPRIQQALLETLSPLLIKKAAARGVFVCYHRADEIFALDMDTGLRAAGVRVWMDTIDMAEGADWRSEVLNALRTCGVMLLVL